MFQNTHRNEATIQAEDSNNTNEQKEKESNKTSSIVSATDSIGKKAVADSNLAPVDMSTSDAIVNDMVVNESNISNDNKESTLSGINDIITQDLWRVASVVWLVGVVLLIIRKGYQYTSFIISIRKEREPVADLNVLSVYSKVAKQLEVYKKPTLYLSNQLGSPMLIGILKPSIYLSSHTMGMDESSMSYILHHELIHYKRYDFLYKWICELVLIVHWFNPFVYLMNKRINKQCEIACDEAVAMDLGKEEKLIYGNVLLQAAEHNFYNQSVLSITLNEDKKSLKERLSSIIHAKRKSDRVIRISIIFAFLLCAVALGLGTYYKNYYAEDYGMSSILNTSTSDTDNNLDADINSDKRKGSTTQTNSANEDNKNTDDTSIDTSDNKNVNNIALTDLSAEEVNVRIDMGNIELKYNTKDEWDIAVDYDFDNVPESARKDILSVAKITTKVVNDTLEIRINAENSSKDIWSYVESKYKRMYYNVGANLTLLVPKSIKSVDLKTAMGEINLEDISGKVVVNTAMGDINAKNIDFIGNSILQTSMGSIYCSVNKNISHESNVLLNTSMGEITIDANSNKVRYSHSDDFMTDSMDITMNKLCELKADTSMGSINLQNAMKEE
jgi:beta-lactamase regulating signal transducer with metallopeptidase domain